MSKFDRPSVPNNLEETPSLADHIRHDLESIGAEPIQKEDIKPDTTEQSVDDNEANSTENNQDQE